MNEIEIILRIMIANAYYYGTTTIIEFNEKSIYETTKKLNELFHKYGYKMQITYEKYKELMLIIFGDTIYVDNRPYNENWFGLYDEEQHYLEMIHLSQEKAKEWIKLMENYNHDFIETGSYILTSDIEVFESERERLDDIYELLLKY